MAVSAMAVGVTIKDVRLACLSGGTSTRAGRWSLPGPGERTCMATLTPRNEAITIATPIRMVRKRMALAFDPSVPGGFRQGAMLEHFQARWNPDFRPKMPQCKKVAVRPARQREAPAVSTPSLSQLRTAGRAAFPPARWFYLATCRDPRSGIFRIAACAPCRHSVRAE